MSVTLDGLPMLAALRELNRETLDEDQADFVEAIEAALCPACGRER